MQELIKKIRHSKQRKDELDEIYENSDKRDAGLFARLAVQRIKLAEYAIELADAVECSLTPDKYQEKAFTTITYNDKFTESERVMYAALGLVNEAGEVAGKIKKYYRDSIDKGVMEELIAQELGDVLWYIAVLAQEFDLSLEKVMQMNLDKLKSRAERGTLQGDGDSR